MMLQLDAIPDTPPTALSGESLRRFPAAFPDHDEVAADAILAVDQHQCHEELAQMQQQWRDVAERMNEEMGGDDVEGLYALFFTPMPNVAPLVRQLRPSSLLPRVPGSHRA